MPVIEKTKKSGMLFYILASALPVAALAVFYILSQNKELMERLCLGFSTPVLSKMGKFWSGTKISVMEWAVVLVIAAAVIFLALLTVKLIKNKGRRLKTALRFLLVLICIFSVVWNGYCWLWNTGYFGLSFAEREGIEAEGILYKDLTAACVFMRDKANELSVIVPRDSSGNCMLSTEQVLDYYDEIFVKIENQFPSLKGDTTRPKGVYFSKIMSRTGFSGVFFPFSGETYINTHQPDWCIPNTVAHEIAHQRGVHLEAECNFIGIAACLQAENLAYRYSGCAEGLVYLMNALYKADREAWLEIYEGFTPELKHDWQESSTYWSEMENTVTKVTDKVYDTFLKVNTQKEGLASYGMCVDMLVTWLTQGGYDLCL